MENKQKKRIIYSDSEIGLKLQFTIFVVLTAIVIIGYIIVDNIIDVRSHRKYSITNNMNLINDIENVTYESDKIIIDGYAFMSNRDSSDDLISVFLRNVMTENEVWLDMEQVDRPDVNAHFTGEQEYKNTGFIAFTKRKKIDNKEVYEIIINIDYVETTEDSSRDIRKTVSTNHYILNGNLYNYNPNEFDKPDMNVESELLRKVFTNGQLCFYQKEEGMYVYQYDGKLYWVATEDFNFEESGGTRIIFHLYTSQVERLSEDRKQYRFDNLDFDFEESEYKDDNTTPYRIAIQDIPEEYAITYITTGIYDMEAKKSYWLKNFQLKRNFY